MTTSNNGNGHHKYTNLNCPLWTKDEVDIVLHYWGKEPLEELALALGRTPNAVAQKYIKLCAAHVQPDTAVVPVLQEYHERRRSRAIAKRLETGVKKLMGQFFIMRRRPNGKWICVRAFDTMEALNQFLTKHSDLPDREDIMLCRKLTLKTVNTYAVLE